MHPLNRPYQLETYHKIINSRAKWVIVEAPTGSGKTAWAAQAAEDGLKTLALVRTKSLQDANYLGSYEFDVLKGKGNYRCGDKMFAWADECDHPCFGNCPYGIAKKIFLQSRHGSLNYMKFMMDRQIGENFNYDIMFLDEAHELPDIVLDFVGVRFSWTDRKLKNYYKTPFYASTNLSQELSRQLGKTWLESVWDNFEAPGVTEKTSLEQREKIREEWRKTPGIFGPTAPDKPNSKSISEDKKRWKYYLRLRQKIEDTLRLSHISPDCWICDSDEDRFLYNPLTVRYHFKNLIDKVADSKIVLMSATIGNPALFCQELGITEYEFIRVPDVWPSPMRPIIDLKAPRMSWQSGSDERNEHAKIIGSKINQCPEHWTGIVHVTSKTKARDLGDRLERMTGRPVWIPVDDMGTEQALKDWLHFRKKNNGALAVAWQFWEGCDLKDDNFSIVAYIPYPDFSDPFEKARFNFDKSSALQRIANQTIQACGRIRRGYPEHYGGMAEKMVAIADGKWSNLRGYISKAVLESVV